MLLYSLRLCSRSKLLIYCLVLKSVRREPLISNTIVFLCLLCLLDCACVCVFICFTCCNTTLIPEKALEASCPSQKVEAILTPTPTSSHLTSCPFNFPAYWVGVGACGKNVALGVTLHIMIQFVIFLYLTFFSPLCSRNDQNIAVILFFYFVF